MKYKKMWRLQSIQLLFITEEQANNIKNIRKEKQVIDDEVRVITAMFTIEIEPVYFVNCSFLDKGLTILSEFPPASKISLIGRNLSYDVLENLLYSNSP